MSTISASDATAISQIQLGNQIATKVAAKAQDIAKQQGQAALSLLQNAMEVQQQSLAHARSGGSLDVTA